MTIEELAEIDRLATILQVKRSVLVRMGLLEVARIAGVTVAIRLKPGISYDRRQTAPRVYADRQQILDRRNAGETTKAIASEYGVTTVYLSQVVAKARHERGIESHQQDIRAELKELAARVLDDPFLAIPARSREIAEALLSHETYEQAAASLGVSRQRVHQVAVAIRKCAIAPDGRTTRWKSTVYGKTAAIQA